MTLRRRLVSITVAVTAAVVICVGVVYGIWDFRQGLAEQRRHAQALLTALTPALTRLHATPGKPRRQAWSPRPSTPLPPHANCASTTAGVGPRCCIGAPRPTRAMRGSPSR